MTAINWLILFSPEQKFFCNIRKRSIKFRINFITLTLSSAQSVDDEYIKNRLLQPFIKWLLRKGATAYIWKAETQNNGNIHFHITTNQYIHWSQIKEKWNSLQDGHGFLNDYTAEYGDNNPNSTDVHSVYNHADMINNVGSYFGKLDEWCRRKGAKVEKDHVNHPSKWLESCDNKHRKFPVPKRQVSGRKWSVSNNLTNIRCCVDDESLTGEEFREVMTDFITNTEHEQLTRDFAEIYIYDERKLFKNMHPLILDKLSDAYNDFMMSVPKT